MINFIDALMELRPNSEWSISGSKYKDLIWNSTDTTKPTEEEIQAKIAELEAAEPMRLLKEERNRLLAETDWRFRIDQEPSQAWYEYCQELRDLPSNSDPQLDENGNLTNVTWPTPPEK
ncbi:MAG: phage tail assembly chaperone [Candidatus Poseidoniales archaeon]